MQSHYILYKEDQQAQRPRVYVQIREIAKRSVLLYDDTEENRDTFLYWAGQIWGPLSYIRIWFSLIGIHQEGPGMIKALTEAHCCCVLIDWNKGMKKQNDDTT